MCTGGEKGLEAEGEVERRQARRAGSRPMSQRGGCRQRDSAMPRVVSKLTPAAGSGTDWKRWRGTSKPQNPGEVVGRVDEGWKYF